VRHPHYTQPLHMHSLCAGFNCACTVGNCPWQHSRPVVPSPAAKYRLLFAPLLCRCCACQVSDFGLSRLVSNEAPVIQTRTYGTVTHMPAELLIEGKMSKAADVYRCAGGSPAICLVTAGSRTATSCQQQQQQQLKGNCILSWWMLLCC
jgi:hypothetical protein